jgi:Domain of unknown function (DUF1707)
VPDEPELRVSDEQREAVAREIREHYAEGRLDDQELSERLHAVYRARTEGELGALRMDLPALPATRRAELAERRSELRRQLIQHTGGALVPFVICTVIWAVSGVHRGPFWPVWVLLVAVIPLLRNGWRLYGPAPELDRVEEELAARERHRHAREQHRQARDTARAARRSRRL